MENMEKVVEFILKTAAPYSKAKSERLYLEEFRKTKKALLMQEALFKGVEAISAQERDASIRGGHGRSRSRVERLFCHPRRRC